MNTHQRIWRKLVASSVIFSMIFLPVMQSAHAASTDISDIPVAVKSRVKPNIIMAYDDSGSMDSEVLMSTNDGAMWWHTGDNRFFGRNASDVADYNAVTKTGTINYNSAGTASATWQKYVNLFPNGTASGARVYADATNDHYAIAPTAEFAYLRSPDFNPIYYNPATTYTPWPPGHNGTALVTYANVSPTAAPSHPGISGSPTFNLTVTKTSTAANETFRMFTGMTIPAGADYRLAGATGGFTNLTIARAIGTGPLAAGEYDVNVPYSPATYYLKDPTGTDAVAPDGSTLKKYTILATDTAQMQNFANWFSYYRKRKLLMNAAVGNVFGTQKDLRMGVTSFSNGAAGSPTNVTMYDFNAAADANNARGLLGQIYAINGNGGTPTKQVLDFVGRQYQRTGTGAPIQFACQFNAAFVFTDGFANSTNPGTPPGNADGSGTYTTQYGNTNTFPYTDTASNTIADIAMYYYRTNLRTDLATGKVPLAQDDTGLPESGPDADRNTNLHMLTYAMGLGVKGTIFGTGAAAAFNPYAAPGPDWTSVYPYVDRSPKSVDDLWHATLNGRGDLVSASNATEAQTAVQAIIDRIKAKDSGAAAVAVANANVVAGDNASYASTYKSNFWSGDLKASPIDLTTGVPNELAPIWTAGSAATQLNAVAVTAATRKIATYSGTTGTNQGRQFQPTSAATTTKLSAAQQTLLNSTTNPPGLTDGAAVVAYLRGDRSGETAGLYRARRSRLGDIINAEPVVVREPFANYTESGYSAFKSANSTRTRIVLQGANDGMLHAFNTATGAEEWAYVPNLLMGSLNNLSSKSGFVHKFYVDGTPVVSDVNFTNTNTSSPSGLPDWKTIVVGGLGKGGRGYYALDVTNTTAASEAAVASKVLWEFPNSATSSTVKANIGYSFGRPIIAKTKAKGWVVLVASGYNNGTNSGDSGGDGQGYLFVLNAATGELIKAISTGVGSVSSPSGFAHISGFVESDDFDRTVEAVYGGDTLGNVWRFDFTSNAIAGWTADKLATLVDSASVAQPITSELELAKVNVSGAFKRFVYVGTGIFLGDSDIPGSVGANANAAQTQTMYALVDDLSNSPLISPLRSNLQQQTLTVSGTTRTASGTAVNFATKKGWYVDLPSAGERANTNPALALGALVFTSNIPSTDPCNLGGTSFFNVLDFKNGGLLTGSTVAWSSISLGEGLASRAVLIKLPTGDVLGLARKSDGTTVAQKLPLPASSGATKRKSWKELLQ